MVTFRKRLPRTLWFFYVLVLYIFLQFCWWAYLIIDLNIQLADAWDTIDPSRDAPAAIQKKLLMVVGEGTVFLLILFIGFLQVRRSFWREVAVARQQRNFLLSVTHEMNSPLASIKLYLQTLLKRNLSEEKQESIIRNALYDVERQSKLVQNILLATQADNSSYQLVLEEMDLEEVVRQVVHVHQAFQTHQIELTSQSLPIQTDRAAMESILHNLLENARKYSPKGTKISVSVKKHESQVELSVADEGPGIPHTEQNQVFEKFYRIGNEDTRKTKGTGLGLYLVRFFTQALSGSIRLKNLSPNGTRFTLLFPAKDHRS